MSAEAIRQQIPLLCGDGGMVYLDNAATALMPAAVIDAVRRYEDAVRANVGRGVYRFAEQASEAYEAARAEVADALQCCKNEVIFTAGCTAGLNLLALALGERLRKNDNVVLSLAEHHSNIVPWQIMAKRRGFNIFYAAPNSAAADGEELLQLLQSKKPRVVSVAHAANVGGGVANLAAIAAAKPAGAVLVVDGAQYAPHNLPNLPACGADFYVFSGHKCYAPNGVGVLWGRHDALQELPPVIGGGGAIMQVGASGHTPADLPQRLEPGTPPITAAIGLGAAMRWRRGLPPTAAAETLQLAQKLRESLAALPRLRLLYPQAKSPIVSFVMEGVHPHDICEVFAARNIAARGGHHCAQPLMEHLGINGCARLSLAPYNTMADVEAAVDAAKEAARLLQ